MMMYARSLGKCMNFAGVFTRKIGWIGNVRCTDEIMYALKNRMPVVALESTIITHGMPYPDNVKCAMDVENIVRKQGAIPATIAILNGEIRAGLAVQELEELADTKISKPIKTSRRDLSYVISNGLNGGTTVSGTLAIASRIGVPIFATGGVGGVHRRSEKTLDISADLVDLGRNNVAVVSSGIKSILDIPKTLEFLETQGVLVATFNPTGEFPAFYSRESGCKAPYTVVSTLQAAGIIAMQRRLNLESGMLFAVPIPEEYAIDSDRMEKVIENALDEAEKARIVGKEITPFLLEKISKITDGKTLKANVALIKNNARVAAEIAVALTASNAEGERGRQTKMKAGNDQGNNNRRTVVIGGSNLDCCVKLNNPQIQFDGPINYGKFAWHAGGVARNLADALDKLDSSPIFLSAIGDDVQGKILLSLTPRNIRDNVMVAKDDNTAQCTVILGKNGECVFLAGDMDIHERITPQMIEENEKIIKKTPLIVFDGNVPLKTMKKLLEMAKDYRIPVFYEPTDVMISDKPFQVDNWETIKYITPNLDELKHLAGYLNLKYEDCDDQLELAAGIASQLTEYVDNVIVTLSSNGALIARRNPASDPLFDCKSSLEQIQIRHYPVESIDQVLNVNGAGDCFAAGLIAAMLKGLSEEKCVSVGYAAAQRSLFSKSAVPECLFDDKHQSWSNSCFYKILT